MNQFELCDKINKNKNLNFIAMALTPWHAIGVNAALDKLWKTDPHMRGLILIGTLDSGITILDRNNFCLSDKTELAAYSFDACHRNFYQKLRYRIQYHQYFKRTDSCSRKLFMITPGNPNRILLNEISNRCPGVRPVCIVVDEGLGSYMRMPINWAVETYHNRNNLKEAVFTCLFKTFSDPGFDRKLKKRGELIDWRLLSKNGGTYWENQESIHSYRRALADATLSSEKYQNYSNAVILNLQLYYETDQIKNNADLQLYQWICNILKKRGIPVIVKPHPRERNPERYDCLGVFVERDHTVAQEKIFAALKTKPRCVIGFTSTSLITSKIFFKIPALSLNRIIPNDQISADLKNEFRHFNKTFQNMIHIPNTQEAFQALLEAL